MRRLVLFVALVLPASASLMDEHNRAWVLVGQRKVDEAIPLLESIIEKDPTFWRAYRTLAAAYRRKKALDAAQNYFQRLLAQTPYAHYGLGWVYDLKDELARGHEEYTACARAGLPVPECYSRLGPVDDPGARLPGRPDHPYACLWFLATLRHQRRIQEALPLGAPCSSLARTHGQDDLLMASLVLAASTLSDTGLWDKALEILQEGWEMSRRLRDWEQEYQFRTVIGGDLTRQDPSRAFEYLTQTLDWVREIGNSEAAEDSLRFLASYHLANGDSDKALRYWWEAYGLADGEVRAADYLQSIGEIYRRRGELPQARRCYEESVQLARRSGGRPAEAFGLRGIGNVYKDSGDYVRAIQYGEESVRLFREQLRPWQAGAGVGNLGIIYSLLADYRTALRLTEESYRSGVAHQDYGEVQRNLLVLSDLYLRTGDLQRAKQKYEQSLALSDKTRVPPFKVGGLIGLGAAHRRLGEYPTALARLEEGRALARGNSLTGSEAQALVEMGHCYLGLREVDRAEAQYSEAAEIVERAGFPELIIAARRGLAEIARRRGRLAQAFEHLRGAIERVETLRGRIPAPDLQAGFVRENARVYEDAIDVLARMPGRAREAFAMAERG
ncbi:MAG: tetratricopeptide repeat protein, partial [Acidobacteria bacterium]|nr:tetratricopeptide repeat protein [Acidobacteriota bacterium]